MQIQCQTTFCRKMSWVVCVYFLYKLETNVSFSNSAKFKHSHFKGEYFEKRTIWNVNKYFNLNIYLFAKLFWKADEKT